MTVFAVLRTEAVMEETWGHLAPEPKTTYPANLLVAISCYDEAVIIDWKVGDLPGSPWLHEHLMDLLETFDQDPGVYRFTGSYRLLVSGQPKWVGTTALVLEGTL